MNINRGVAFIVVGLNGPFWLSLLRSRSHSEASVKLSGALSGAPSAVHAPAPSRHTLPGAAKQKQWQVTAPSTRRSVTFAARDMSTAGVVLGWSQHSSPLFLKCGGMDLESLSLWTANMPSMASGVFGAGGGNPLPLQGRSLYPAGTSLIPYGPWSPCAPDWETMHASFPYSNYPATGCLMEVNQVQAPVAINIFNKARSLECTCTSSIHALPSTRCSHCQPGTAQSTATATAVHLEAQPENRAALEWSPSSMPLVLERIRRKLEQLSSGKARDSLSAQPTGVATSGGAPAVTVQDQAETPAPPETPASSCSDSTQPPDSPAIKPAPLNEVSSTASCAAAQSADPPLPPPCSSPSAGRGSSYGSPAPCSSPSSPSSHARVYMGRPLPSRSATGYWPAAHHTPTAVTPVKKSVEPSASSSPRTMTSPKFKLGSPAPALKNPGGLVACRVAAFERPLAS